MFGMDAPYPRDEDSTTLRQRSTKTAKTMVPFCDTKLHPSKIPAEKVLDNNIPLVPLNGQPGDFTERGTADGSSGSSREPEDQNHAGEFLVEEGRDEQVEDEVEDTEPLLVDDEEEKIKLSIPVTEDESSWTIFLQVAFPFLIAGVGMVGAGLVLDIVQHWRVFTQVPEIFILVPALLGLKGNLEMTLASRLSTLANLGRMDCKKEQAKQITSNLALIQAQAIVVAFLASLFAITLAWIPKGKVDWNHALLLSASSLTTASLASLLLGIIMVGVVLLSRKYRINPDNVATPIAASLGDLTTLAVLSWFGMWFIGFRDSAPWLNGVVSGIFVVLAPFWMWVASQNPGTFEVLKHGWSPVIFAMLISRIAYRGTADTYTYTKTLFRLFSGGGFILRFAVTRFGGIAVFQPVINDVTARASRVLLLMVIPGHLIFIYVIHFLQAGHTTITLLFSVVYLSAALIQVACLLHICVGMVYKMWECEVDPDNSAIPYLTALGDLLGTGLLAASFLLLSYLGDRDADVGE